MAKTTAITPLQQVAHSFFQWYRGADTPEETLLAIQASLGSPISPEELRQISERLRNNAEFMASQGPLIDKWQTRMQSGEVLSEEESQTLIQEIFDSFDHALLFDQGVTANSTLTRRGEISDSEQTIPGKMPCWTLHLTIRGNALFLDEKMEVAVGPGHMMLFRPDAEYHYGLHPSADLWEHLWALFQPRSHWQELLDWNSTQSKLMHLELATGDERDTLEQLFLDLIGLNGHQGAYRNELQMNKLEEILIRAAEYSSEKRGKSMDQRVQQACDYMQAHLTEKFSVEDVAAACNLSSSRLSHLFKQQLGIGPKAWVNSARLQRARQLLLTSSDSIGEIATRIGYEDPGQFTKYFKKNLGCSPKEFRRGFTRTEGTGAMLSN